jgi:hypothetical protein
MLPLLAALALGGCSSSKSSGNTGTDGGPTGSSAGGRNAASGGATGTSGAAPGGGTSGGTKTAASVAAKVGRSNFLIGLGNDDNDGAYSLGVTLDIRYVYLAGLLGRGGWPDWNPDGTFVNVVADAAKQHGVIPMFTLYQMAAAGEANSGVLTDNSYMGPYWNGVKLMYQRLAAFGDPAVVQFEPDWWAYAQLGSPGGDPSKLTVNVASLAPDCSSLPNTMVGMGKCLVVLARKYAPKVIVGFHASGWADPDPTKVASYLVKIGAAEGDFLTTDTLDRDAGCFEAHTDPGCQRTEGNWYWDETNQKSPNFHDHLAWVKQITDGVGKPMLWWQTPLGVPSATPGGKPGHYRDNRVKYVFSHIDEFVAANGLGAVFGTGAGNQTDVTTDGDQYKNAVAKYFASPVPLP